MVIILKDLDQFDTSTLTNLLSLLTSEPAIQKLPIVLIMGITTGLRLDSILTGSTLDRLWINDFHFQSGRELADGVADHFLTNFPIYLSYQTWRFLFEKFLGDGEPVPSSSSSVTVSNSNVALPMPFERFISALHLILLTHFNSQSLSFLANSTFLDRRDLTRNDIVMLSELPSVKQRRGVRGKLAQPQIVKWLHDLQDYRDLLGTWLEVWNSAAKRLLPRRNSISLRRQIIAQLIRDEKESKMEEIEMMEANIRTANHAELNTLTELLLNALPTESKTSEVGYSSFVEP